MPTIRIAFLGTVFVWLSLGVSLGRNAVAGNFNVLMIGNSYTQGNSSARAVSLDLQGLFDADPDHSANVTVRADSSSSLQNHVGNPATTGLITNPANVWDVIILQERSIRPALAMKYGGSELNGLNQGGPVMISSYIEPFQPQAAVLLFNTWARAINNEDLIEDFNNDPEEMLLYTNQGYNRIQQNLPTWDFSDVTTIARVGDAWGDWYNTYGYVSPYGLHLSDGTHQNDRGAYLAASVIFESITGKSTVGNGYTGAVTGSIDGISQVVLLQQQATAVTGATAGLPGDYNHNGIIDAADYAVWRDALEESATMLLNDPTPGVVDESDFVYWRAHFGESLSDGSRSFRPSSVPEPCSASQLLFALLWLSSSKIFRAIGQAACPQCELKTPF